MIANDRIRRHVHPALDHRACPDPGRTGNGGIGRHHAAQAIAPALIKCDQPPPDGGLIGRDHHRYRRPFGGVFAGRLVRSEDRDNRQMCPSWKVKNTGNRQARVFAQLHAFAKGPDEDHFFKMVHIPSLSAPTTRSTSSIFRFPCMGREISLSDTTSVCGSEPQLFR